VVAEAGMLADMMELTWCGPERTLHPPVESDWDGGFGAAGTAGGSNDGSNGDGCPVATTCRGSRIGALRVRRGAVLTDGPGRGPGTLGHL